MDRHDIIVVGASAGGLDSLKALLGPLTADFPGSLFFVTHLAPGQSRLDEMLAACTSLRVLFAEDGAVIRPGTLLIAPPERHMLLERERVLLTRGPRENLWRPSIDVLFRSAAVAFRSRAVGVVLSGSLDDGAAGLAAIAGCGGVAIVECPSEAAYPDMPQAALRAVPDARVCKASEIAAILRTLVAEPVREPPPVPEQIILEARVAAGDEAATRELEARGKATNFSCPECGGPLNREPAGTLRFRCRLGHAYADASLGEASAQVVESSLWAAIRLLEQRANLDRTRGNEERARGRTTSAARYDQRAAEINGHAHVLRQMLRNLPAQSGSPTRECSG